jgi:NAD(P)-dependent dehydrogenase (short-subunit alcohol dehydrogenase family)
MATQSRAPGSGVETDRDLAALVTGGGTGQGYAIARRLLARGVSVLICGYEDQATLDEARDRLIAESGGTCKAMRADLLDPEVPAAIVAACVEAFGSIDILVNNAGIWDAGEWAQMNVDSWDRSQRLMVQAPMLTIQAAVGAMAGRGCRVINNASISAQLSEPGSAIYSAAKAALKSLTESAAIDLATEGVRVNALAPGWIRSAMSESYLDSLGPKEIAKLNPIGRAGVPDDVAAVAEFLALDAPDYLTGQTIFIDGGQSVLLLQPVPGEAS